MSEKQTNIKENEKFKGLFSLFSGRELKTFFKKYIVFIVVIEILIFMICWLYQIGAIGYDRFGPVESSFPWKVYFITAFMVPVGITFMFGVFIVTFEHLFFHGRKINEKNKKREEKTIRLRQFLTFVFHSPFLAFVLVLGVILLLFLDFDRLSFFLESSSKNFFEGVKILLIGLSAGLTLVALGWLLFRYKLKRKEMDYLYRLKLAEKTGVVWIEKDKVIEKDGKIIILGKKGDESDDLYLPGIKPNDDN
ncbi:MAG: hypothetical protein RBR53_00260 [Desulforegulaceae bacterium]|nr:hypothetical protein [Desulforegulaceae bacterium]